MDRIKSIILDLPHLPGVYKFFDAQQQIIYVGKAKDLRNRVASYFSKVNYDSFKTSVLVKKIRDIDYVVVENESEALLLENNLIKKLQPRYNVLLKDDKTFPWICIKNEAFPRVFSTRKYIQDGSIYYGPFTSARMVKTLIELIRKLYPIRTCSLNLSSEKISKGNYKVCLEYHMDNCKGPCEGYMGEAEYNANIQKIKTILKGNIQEVVRLLKEDMQGFVEKLEFEKAYEVKQKIRLIEQYQNKSLVVNTGIKDVDVFTIMNEKKHAYVNYLKIINGAIIQTHSAEIQKKLDEQEYEILQYAVIDFRERFKSHAREVLLEKDIQLQLDDFDVRIPKIGDKKKLIELSRKNLLMYRLERQRQKSLFKTKKSELRVLNTLKDDLQMHEIPEHVECFDNSNIQGSNPVSACVVFKNGKPSKKDYRHFHIKTVKGPDDFKSMYESVYRRYQRLKNEAENLPQLVVIDGGKGQLSAAVKALSELDLMNEIKIIGIAKKLEEIFQPGDSVPLYIDKNSESLKLIQHLRNEAHRFGIEFHRDMRSKSMTKSVLDEIYGVGPKTKDRLIGAFKTIENIKKAPKQELEEIIGTSKAEIVHRYFQSMGSGKKY